MFSVWHHTAGHSTIASRSADGRQRSHSRVTRKHRVSAFGAKDVAAGTPSVSEFLASLATADAQQTAQPHFGTAAISQLVDQAAHTLTDASGVALPNITLTIPENTFAGLPALTTPVPSLLHDTTSALSALQTTLQSALDAPASTPLPPHFGTAALTTLLSALSTALSQTLTSLAPADPRYVQTLTTTLANLNAATTLLTSLPTTLSAALTTALNSNPTTSHLLSLLSSLATTATSTSTKALSTLTALTTTATTSLLPPTSLPTPQDALAAAAAALAAAQANGVAGVEFGTFCLVCAGALAAIAASTPPEGYEGISVAAEMTLTPEYSPEFLEQYFARRPVEVMQRAAEVAEVLSRFGLSIMMDLWTGRLKANEEQRANEVRELIERLGPAYVKVAQAISTRVDLLPPAYFRQIQRLQDRVPPFPCSVARGVIQQELGLAVETVFSELSERPVAAASLGQVYRGVVREQYGGGEVAVKVQRPGVLEQVALDLHLMRGVALWLKGMPEVNTDWVALIDSWAGRFFHEMDYRREANNAVVFKEQMAGLDGILVPLPNLRLTTDCLLVSAWVPGEKLSDSKSEDVRELCNTLLNCYLIQLLDTGFLHADPHPGNLIRTPDGRIAILDYGLMTEVTEQQRLALTEYIAHLLTEDWPNVALDLQRLGFIPPEVTDVQGSGLVLPLASILKQLSGGGGATKLNIDQVMEELESLGRNYPFQIPAFFALILRAFSVIEGIALGADPDYAIVQECFPYMSRRLLQDNSPRAKQALRDVLYGDKQRLDVQRLQRLVDAFQGFTTQGLLPSGGASKPPAGAPAAPGGATVDPMLREALVAVFSQRGSYVQELLVEEMVAAVDALSREALTTLVGGVLGSPPVVVAMSTVENLGPLRPLLLPFPTPPEILSRLAPAVAVSKEDEEALLVVRGILQIAQRLPAPDMRAASDLVRVVPEVAPLVWELAPGMLHTGELFVRQFLRRLALRTAAELGDTGTDYASAMSALGFMPLSSSPLGSAPVGSSGSSVITLSTSAWAPQQQQQPGAEGSSMQQEQQGAGGIPLGLLAAPVALAAAPLMIPLALAAMPLAVFGHFAVHGFGAREEGEQQ